MTPKQGFIATIAAFESFLYTLVACIAMAVQAPFRPAFYMPQPLSNWYNAETALVRSLVWVVGILFIFGQLHSVTQRWLGRNRPPNNNVPHPHWGTFDLTTTFLPLAGAVLVFVLTFLAIGVGLIAYESWRFYLQVLYALMIVGACRGDIHDTIVYWSQAHHPARQPQQRPPMRPAAPVQPVQPQQPTAQPAPAAVPAQPLTPP